MGTGVSVSVIEAVGSGAGVSVGDMVFVSVGAGNVTILVVGLQAASVSMANRESLFNTLSSYPIFKQLDYRSPSNKSVSFVLPPFTRLKAR